MPKITKTPPSKSVQDILKNNKRPRVLWDGPESATEQGGITQSLLGRWMVCPERFRLYAIEGRVPKEGFKKYLEYGNMWHTCEEAVAAGRDWKKDLIKYAGGLLKKYPEFQDEVNKWYEVCKCQFPVAQEYWAEHEEDVKRDRIMEEYSFSVPYKLPSGKVVFLRGKMDGVEWHRGLGKDSGVYLGEHKAKGDPDKQAIMERLRYDKQTMIYLTALLELMEQKEFNFPKSPELKGVYYNVIKMPLSGGVGSIRPKKATKKQRAESMEEYYARLGDVIRENADRFFLRFRATVSLQEIMEFREKTLDPCLENICLWYNWIASPDGLKNPFGSHLHWQRPFGIYNPVDEGRQKTNDYDNYLLTGNDVGLGFTDTLFEELEEEDA